MKNNIKASSIFTQLLLVFMVSKNVKSHPLTHEKCSLESSDCLKRQAQAELHTFVQGVSELGIKKLDRLHLDDINVKTPDLLYQLWNIKIGGFNNTIIDDLSIHSPFKLMRINFHTTLMVECDYKVDGLFFGIPVIGEGKSAMILQNLQMEMIILFDIVNNEQGKDIMDIKSYFYGADTIDGVHTYLGNLYNGDKKKSDVFHEIMNKNWRTAVANFGRIFTANISKKIFDGIQKYMRSQPLEDLAQY